ncbi:HAMP domain-containing histidine kinase [Vibrio sp. JC009]|uniref:sensor histidine kinase n=1 Tax=Vibrio sp. JC009 TaxID=2912314 RepID=UPI0023B206EA|nr:HAMP domain-containing sensor histidine kinase [Vibrio sp. JC009]WED23759.1 HAMP domain-containing histidine kinase [Vibrio sp. JC009]
MKIRLSLKLYVLAAVMLTGTITIFAFSALSMQYFFSGMDMVMERTLASEAFTVDASDGKPFVRNIPQLNRRGKDTFYITSRWEDLPERVQTLFKPEELEFHHFTKKVFGASILNPPEEGYFVMKVQTDKGLRYTAATIQADKDVKVGKFSHVLVIALTAVGAIALFSLVLILIMRSVASPVERLKFWAKHFSEKDLEKPAPDFQYNELNTLATIIKASLGSVHETLQREKRFLGFASHELRTPIAVTRTNSELLRKLIEKEKSKEKQLEVLERIERAGLTMTDLTETLLWLNRDEEKTLPAHEIHLGQLVQQVTHELDYLIQSKPVTVEITTDNSACELPETLCRIILNNLIRNAFQHTHEGKVVIRQSGLDLTILNQNQSDSMISDDLGFGLGLELVKKLIGKYEWSYTTTELDAGREVSIKFSSPEPESPE